LWGAEKMANETGKHTPGPWGFGTSNKKTYGMAPGEWWETAIHVGDTKPGNVLATAVMGGSGATRSDRESVEANARLIAAAPELLEALKECLPQIRWASIHGSRCDELIAEVEAAIRKATEGE
jgi:hypothetical protein